MDHERLVRKAQKGDVDAFVELTRRFQHFAFGSALAQVRDFQQAEDIVQEAFLAAWSALTTLAEPSAFPGWLRGIVRHHAFRVLRRKQLHTVPLTEGEDVPSDDPSAERIWNSGAKPPPRLPPFRSYRPRCASPPHCSSFTNVRIRTSQHSSACRSRPSTIVCTLHAPV